MAQTEASTVSLVQGTACYVIKWVHMISFYLLYILVSLIEDSLKLATFYFRLDMGPVGIILAKISLELVYSRILGETQRKLRLLSFML